MKLAAYAATVALILTSASASAAPNYTGNVVFGDSLSDQGNLADYLGHNLPTPPFYHDSFTNGQVAVQVLDNRLGLSTNPSLFVTGGADLYNLGLARGTNYAVAGATAGNSIGEGVTGANLASQLGGYFATAGSILSGTDLYTLFIGGNDVRTAAHTGNAALVTNGVTSELSALGALIAAGAKNLLVVNVPDVGVIPEFTQGYPSQGATATQDTLDYNTGLAAGVATLQSANPASSIKLFDLYTFQKSLLADPGSLGITNITDPCYPSYGGVTNNAPLVINPACGAIDPATGQAANIGTFAFWDTIHPTAKVQAAVGNALADSLGATATGAVPEPSSWAMIILGFGLLGASLRYRRPQVAVAFRQL